MLFPLLLNNMGQSKTASQICPKFLALLPEPFLWLLTCEEVGMATSEVCEAVSIYHVRTPDIFLHESFSWQKKVIAKLPQLCWTPLVCKAFNLCFQRTDGDNCNWMRMSFIWWQHAILWKHLPSTRSEETKDSVFASACGLWIPCQLSYDKH